MITKYKGFEIDVTRDTNMVREALFCYISRISDGYLLYDEIRYDADESVREATNNLKKWIDIDYHRLKYEGVEVGTNLYNELLDYEENNILYPR